MFKNLSIVSNFKRKTIPDILCGLRPLVPTVHMCNILYVTKSQRKIPCTEQSSGKCCGDGRKKKIHAGIMWYSLTWSRGAWLMLGIWFCVHVQKQRQCEPHCSHICVCNAHSEGLIAKLTRWHIITNTPHSVVRFSSQATPISCLSLILSALIVTFVLGCVSYWKLSHHIQKCLGN